MGGKLGLPYHGREGWADYVMMVGKVGETTSSWLGKVGETTSSWWDWSGGLSTLSLDRDKSKAQ